MGTLSGVVRWRGGYKATKMLCCNWGKKTHRLHWLSHPSTALLVLDVRKSSNMLPGFIWWLFCNSDCPTWGFWHTSAESRMVLSLNRCDADPSALANYVVALVKKDKPEKELKAFCADQLDVFLQKGTVLSTTLSVRWFSFHWGGGGRMMHHC